MTRFAYEDSKGQPKLSSGYEKRGSFPAKAARTEGMVVTAQLSGCQRCQCDVDDASDSISLRVIFILCYLITIPLIRLPFLLIYYSWRPNRPRKNWTLGRTINVQVLRKLTKLPLKFGVADRRDLSLEVPQEDLEPLNVRFVWIPELDEKDIVGVVAEHADRAGVKSIAIPAYWMLKEGTKWSPEYDKAGQSEKVMLYFHGGGFVVCFFPPFFPVFAPTLISGWICTSISPNSIDSQGIAQAFHVSLQSIVGRVPTKRRASRFRSRKPVSERSHRRDCGVQISRLRDGILAPKYHRWR